MGLLEIYEENCWEILERLRDRAIKSGQAKMLKSTLPADFKNPDKKFKRQGTNISGRVWLSYDVCREAQIIVNQALSEARQIGSTLVVPR